MLGLDPGLATTGYGATEYERASTPPEALSWGTVTTDKDTDFTDRLNRIHASVNELVDKFSPDVVVVEKLYFSKNVKTAIKVGQARGVIVLGATHDQAELVEYSPLKIKKTVTGTGSASKRAVQTILQKELGIQRPPEPDDAADALAAAYCYQMLSRFESQIPSE